MKMRHIPIVHSQLSPPPIRDRFVQRSHLNKKLMQIPNYPLTLLYAGAGYGKSTALSLFTKNRNAAVCWYSISKNDDDLFPFLTKLISSIRQCHPRFGNSIEKELMRLDNYMNTEEIYSLATFFINEVIQLDEEILIILDDFHLVMNSSEIENMLLYVVEYIPSNLHMIVSSRKKPRWNILPKLRGQGELLELTHFDFVLSPAEMSYILEEIYKTDVLEEEVAQIYRATEGWAIAFNMLAQQIAENTSITAILQNKKKSLKDLFAYLASEVLSKQSLITQQFLMQSSIFHVLSPEICDHVLEIQGSEEILVGLVEQNLFIEEGEGNVYRYHALFQAFLENLFMRKYENEFNLLHKRAASYYKQVEDLESALYHYKKINESQAIAALLNEHGCTMLQSGRLQALYDLLVELPDNYKGQYPLLYFYQGEIERYRSLYDQAEHSYNAISDAITKGDKAQDYIMSLALEGKARIYLDTIQPDRAEHFVNQAIQLREKASASKEEMARLYVLMAENLLNAGQAVKAEVWYDRAKRLNLPLEESESNLQARIYLRTGRLAQAKEILIARKQQNAGSEKEHLPQSHRETDLILSIIEAFMGNEKASKQLASDSIQLGLAIKSPFVEACGWMRLGHAVQLINQYNHKLAIQCYQTSLDIMEKINVSRGKAEPYMGLSILYGKQQAYSLAMDNAKRGLLETEKVNDRWLSALIKLGIAITEVYRMNYDQAVKAIEKVRTDMIACGDRYVMMVTSFWSAYIAFEKGEVDGFKEEMIAFLTAVQAEAYDFFLKRRTTFGPLDMQNMAPMLLKAKQLDIESTIVTRMLSDLGLDKTVKNHPGYTLVIQTLGQFKLWLGTKQIESNDWQRGKSKELFELFITNRNIKLQREEIFQSLWPDQDEKTATKNFKVTLNALLKVLEPHRKAREDSFFIIREGSSYGINPDAVYELDTITFEALILKGLEESNPKHAAELLEKGLMVYQGDYLKDLRFISWCTTERERLRQLFLRGAERLAQHSVRLLDFHRCIEWCEKILSLDSTWEEAYRLMMYCYYQNNNRPQAIRWYEKCCNVLQVELGIEPMQQTEEIYDLIMESEELDKY